MSDTNYRRFCAGIIIGALFLGTVVFFGERMSYRRQLIENNCGQYNSQTGAFEWKNWSGKP